MWGYTKGSMLYVTTPLEVKAYIEAIPMGHARTVSDMRQDLAAKAKADTTCPMTSAIFVRIVAEAALDEMRAGKSALEITPFWRLIDETSPIAKRLSCDADFIAHQKHLET